MGQWLGVRRMLSNKRLDMGCVEGYLLYYAFTQIAVLTIYLIV